MTIYKSQPLRFGQPDGKIPLPNQDEFTYLYEIQNKSRKELAIHYGVSKGTVDKWCVAFGVKKTKKQQINLALKNTKDTNREGYYSEKLFAEKPELKSATGSFYIVRIYNDTESFFKFGITRTGAHLRYRGRLLYSYEIVLEEVMDLYAAYLKEQEYKQTHKSNLYKPKIKFSGHTECYISHPPATHANV